MNHFLNLLRKLKGNLVFWSRCLLRPRKVDIGGVWVSTPPELGWTMRKILYRGRYETREYQLVNRYLETADKVVEIGAGLGFITSLCARKTAGNVVSFEANPGMLPHIRETLRLNGVSADLRNGAVNSSAGRIPFFVCDNFWSSSTTQRKGSREKIQVPAFAFEECLAEIEPTFLVMDIEGGELDLVGVGIPDSVRTIIVELHSKVYGDEEGARVKRWLSSCGFSELENNGLNRACLFQRALPAGSAAAHSAQPSSAAQFS